MFPALLAMVRSDGGMMGGGGDAGLAGAGARVVEGSDLSLDTSFVRRRRDLDIYSRVRQ